MLPAFPVRLADRAMPRARTVPRPSAVLATCVFIRLQSAIAAPIGDCFELSLSVDAMPPR
jgi:hypothetical protein